MDIIRFAMKLHVIRHMLHGGVRGFKYPPCGWHFWGGGGWLTCQRGWSCYEEIKVSESPHPSHSANFSGLTAASHPSSNCKTPPLHKKKKKSCVCHWVYAVEAQTSLAPLSWFHGSRVTTAHAHQCCIFQSYAKTVPSRMKLTMKLTIDAWASIHDNGHVITACDVWLQQRIMHMNIEQISFKITQYM